jgi:hypothetical protein
MKLICTVTHGMGDWYLPLSILPDFMEKNNIKHEDLTVYVDSVYGANPGAYPQHHGTGVKMLNSVTKNWKFVPPQFFGSGDWYGIPDRVLGPQYKDIKNDFLFYRGPGLKDYMRKELAASNAIEPTKFISGTGLWSYEWNGQENIPLDFSGAKPLKCEPMPPEEKAFVDSIVQRNALLIHARKKGHYATDGYFQTIINFCNQLGIATAVLGLGWECRLMNMTYDLREKISYEQTMYLLENLNHMVTSGSMYTFHRFHFPDKKSIIGLMEHNVDRYHCFEKKYLENPNNIIYNSDVDHMPQLMADVKRWYNK